MCDDDDNYLLESEKLDAACRIIGYLSEVENRSLSSEEVTAYKAALKFITTVLTTSVTV